MGASSCGGIKGANTTFQESLNAGILPKSSSLAFNSLFSKYIFDLKKNDTKELVDLSLNLAQAKNPLTNEMEKYLAIGLLSSEDGKNYREPLSLIIVLDVSGSMNCTLSKGNKMDLAKSCVKNIYKKLNHDEALGLVTFNNSSQTILNLQKKKNINEEEFFNKVEKLIAGGGTSIMLGYNSAVKMMNEELKNLTGPVPNNKRIIFITDALINDKSESDDLFNLNLSASTRPSDMFTTFIGVGIDFDTDLIARLTKVRGSNYFAVHSDQEFIKTLQDDFNYIVTPISFEVYVKVESSDFEIERTYGSDFDFNGDETQDSVKEMKKGGVIRLETLMAYEKNTEGIKGGVVLVKLKEKEGKKFENQESKKMNVVLQYEDVSGLKKEKQMTIEQNIPNENEEFPCSGVRKALCLTRYVCFVKELIEKKKDIVKAHPKAESFLAYFKQEMKALNDKELEGEYENLLNIINL